MKKFTAKYNIWKREKDLENTKEVVTEFKRRPNIEVKQQEKLNMMKKRDFRRRELLEKYSIKILYKWDNKKFEEEYLKKLERNWQKQKSVSLEEKF